MNATELVHSIINGRIGAGAFCIDATAGRGRDTAYLCELVGPCGRVIAFDIQQEAVDSTNALLAARGLRAEVHLDSHSNMANYAEPETVDCIVFNLGWLPGGDHRIFTHADTSFAAISAGLELLKKGGIYITSGIIDDKEQTVVEAVKAAGLEVLEVTYQGEWVSVTARKN